MSQAPQETSEKGLRNDIQDISHETMSYELLQVPFLHIRLEM